MVLTPVMTPDDLHNAQAQVIEFIDRFFVDGVHFEASRQGDAGKRVLLKAGAELLATIYGLTPIYQTKAEYIGDDLDFEVITEFVNQHGEIVSRGIGSCSTLEKKFKVRYNVVETDIAVPKKYWDNRDVKILKAAAPDLAKPAAVKTDAGWRIGEKTQVANPYPGDEFNPVRKIGKKRSYVDAIINAFILSEYFTQDVEKKEIVGAADPEERFKQIKRMAQAAWAKSPTDNEMMNTLRRLKEMVTTELPDDYAPRFDEMQLHFESQMTYREEAAKAA